MFTIGFEVENFRWIDMDDNTFSEYREILQGYGFYNFHWDGSGPYEFASPPWPVFSRHPNPYALIVGILFEFSESEMVEENEYGETRTAGCHCHVAYQKQPRNYEKLYKYLREYLPIFQWMMSLSFEVSNDLLRPLWTDKRRREYWAGEPPETMPSGREYYAVTPNPADSMKPFTLEVRMCETWPLKCILALRYLLAGFLADVKIEHSVWYYDDDIPKDVVVKYIEAVEARAPERIPEWARRMMRKLLKHGDVINTEDAIAREYLSKDEVYASLREVGVIRETLKMVPVGQRRIAKLTALVYSATRVHEMDRRICKYVPEFCEALGF